MMLFHDSLRLAIDQKILMSILREKIQDNRFLRLIENLLKTGDCEQWKYHSALSGTPQGSIVSPILANIYLDKLDKFVEQALIPKYTLGKVRAENPEYTKLVKLAWYHSITGKMDIWKKHVNWKFNPSSCLPKMFVTLDSYYEPTI